MLLKSIDDRQTDSAMPSGSTSKTWSPAQDRNFWTEHDQSRDTGSAASASQAMPQGDCNYMRGGDHQALLGIRERVAQLTQVEVY